MRRSFDRLDFFVALGLFLGVAAWAFRWAHPYPHPDLWPFLVAVRGKIGTAALGVAGRLSLGAFAAFVYLVIRGFWSLCRNHDSQADDFCFTRTAPICGAVALTAFPCAWRAGQFLSPGFALLVLTLFGFCLWFLGRRGQGLLACSSAYLLFGFAGGANPFGLAALGFAAVSDVITRRRHERAHGQHEDGDYVRRKRSVEARCSFFAAVIGWLLGAWLDVAVASWARDSSALGDWIVSWWTVWAGAVICNLFTRSMLMTVLAIAMVAAGLAIGRHVRSLESRGRTLGRDYSVVLALLTLVMMVRAVDGPERVRLQAIREYVALVADDVREAKFLFTDGCFDDMLRLEFALRGLKTVVLNTMSAPDPKESARLKALAPEPADRTIFAAGGAEVFKAWARERPDRLAECAWQLGGGIVRRYGKAQCRTHGSVIRCEDAARAADDDAADRRFVDWSRRIAAIAEEGQCAVSLFAGVDDAVAARFDALLWRAARIAGERAERQSSAKSVAAAESERQTMRQLDGLNASLRTQGEIVERMLPTEKLVFTAREALEVALKRADFELARRYADEILAGSPDDSAANFALGMANLEAKEYFRASVCFEKALRKHPNEPAALNNLAIAYMKQGMGEKALQCAERAAKAYPQSAQIRQTLAEIRKNVSN